ncbi:MAG: SUMF1/EgtB/PvdO family nonheme iron enzyme [Candidatus Eremiobacteraeota bacterium]|nr:SUMF1/EgtB/PvdO family nonheme iron enzyme [Candidatus Eremiobacteraeota bacterium]
MRRLHLLTLLLVFCLACARPPALEELRAATPEGMVLVPGGEFLTGTNDPDADSEVGPLRPAQVASFYIDLTEVTNAQVKAVKPDHTFPEGEEDHPATGFTRPQAAAILARMDKRLPTALEWEKAARGTDGRSYPWGNRYDEKLAHVGRAEHRPNVCSLTSRLAAVGSYPGGASPYGCLDMVGNAWEWVADDYPGRPVRHLIRGGAFGYPARDNRAYAFAIEQVGVT